MLQPDLRVPISNDFKLNHRQRREMCWVLEEDQPRGCVSLHLLGPCCPSSACALLPGKGNFPVISSVAGQSVNHQDAVFLLASEHVTFILCFVSSRQSKVKIEWLALGS